MNRQLKSNDAAMAAFARRILIEYRFLIYLLFPLIAGMSALLSGCDFIAQLMPGAFSISSICLLANFRPSKPVRIMWEGVWVLLLLYAVLVIPCWVSYLIYGQILMLDSVIDVFCFKIWRAAAIPAQTGLCACSFCLLMKYENRKFLRGDDRYRAKKKKRLQGNGLETKIDSFLMKHTSLYITRDREFIFFSLRNAVWGAVLSLLVVELFGAGLDWIDHIREKALAVQSKTEKGRSVFDIDNPFRFDIDGCAVNTTNCGFTVGSLVGERFGRVLSCDVERKKLSEPIGVIDELMLQSDGAPDRRLTSIYGQRYLGDVSDEEANRLVEEVCTALQTRLECTVEPGDGPSEPVETSRDTVARKNRIPFSREYPAFIGVLKPSLLCGDPVFCMTVYSGRAYALVMWENYFFQKSKVLKLLVGLTGEPIYDRDVLVTDVMGHKLGVPMCGDRKPREPFWKFEEVWRGTFYNKNIVWRLQAMHDVSSLSLAEAESEFEEARKAVERQHGIKMFKNLDYENNKQYDFYGRGIVLSVKMEFLGKKQISYCVTAAGKLRARLHGMSSSECHRPMRKNGMLGRIGWFFLFSSGVCLIQILQLCVFALKLRRNDSTVVQE